MGDRGWSMRLAILRAPLPPMFFISVHSKRLSRRPQEAGVRVEHDFSKMSMAKIGTQERSLVAMLLGRKNMFGNTSPTHIRFLRFGICHVGVFGALLLFQPSLRGQTFKPAMY